MDDQETIELPPRRDAGLGEVLSAWVATAEHLTDQEAIGRLIERLEDARRRLQYRFAELNE